jgi:hypothetical protein
MIVGCIETVWKETFEASVLAARMGMKYVPILVIRQCRLADPRAMETAR